jgi:hypothetical protein
LKTPVSIAVPTGPFCDRASYAILRVVCNSFKKRRFVSGLQNKTLRRQLPDKHSGQVSRLLKRLRVHGFIKKVGRTYKHYLTQFGKDVVATGLKLRELVVIPQLAFGQLA